ncbi:MAG: hypothetical protein ACC661_11220 [Verrucomicrobiales bacterium]
MVPLFVFLIAGAAPVLADDVVKKGREKPRTDFHPERPLLSPGKRPAIKTLYGRTFQEVVILQNDPHGITFRHRDGIAKLPFAELGESLRQQYGYDRGKALEYLEKRRASALERRALPSGDVRRVYVVNFRHPEPAEFSLRFRPDFVTPDWLYPPPASVPYSLHAWRQLSLLQLMAAHWYGEPRPLAGFGDVHRVYDLPWSLIPGADFRPGRMITGARRPAVRTVVLRRFRG